MSLNDDWIQNFEKKDKLYQDFYKDDLYYINLKIIYINKGSEIEKIKQDTFLMSKPNYISREEIIRILKNNSIDNNRKYTLLTILKYVINLDCDDIKSFLNSSDDYNFISLVKNIDAITFDKSISMFQDLNDLILIFYEKTLSQNTPHNLTKRILMTSSTRKKKHTRKTI